MFSPDDGDFDPYEALPYRMTAETRDVSPTPPDAGLAAKRRMAAPPAYDDTETSYATMRCWWAMACTMSQLTAL